MPERGRRFSDMRSTTGSKLPTSTTHTYILQNYLQEASFWYLVKDKKCPLSS